ARASAARGQEARWAERVTIATQRAETPKQRGFLDFGDAVPTVFTKNRDRLLEAAVARKFLAELLAHRQVRALLSDDHFSVDGTQVQAWASMKSFVEKDGSDEPPSPGATASAPFSRRAAKQRDA